MNRKLRISIARLMGVVLVAALGSAVLRNSSQTSAGIMLLFTCGALMLAVVGVLCRGREERAWWLGFVLFGGGYLALAYWTAAYRNPLPTITLAEVIGSWRGLTITPTSRRVEDWDSLAPSYRILHCLWALGLGLVGCLLSGFLVGGNAPAPSDPVDETGSARRSSRARWKWPALVGLSAFWIVAMAAAVGRWPAPGIWAGASFLLTCGLLGMAALGAVFSRGRQRESWLGAALFGFGYLALSFGQSQLFIVTAHMPTEGMINSLVRPDGPPIHSDLPDFTTEVFPRVRNDAIMRKMDQPIAMHFPRETSLDEVLKHIRNATKDANFPGIPIYVDPIGLETAERTLSSTVQLDVDAIPVRVALRLCLKQLGLGFSVRSGVVMISDKDSATIPVYEDPVQVVGHSLLALIAAGLGAVSASFVSDRVRQSRRGETSEGDSP